MSKLQARASRPCVGCTIRTGGTPVPLLRLWYNPDFMRTATVLRSSLNRLSAFAAALLFFLFTWPIGKSQAEGDPPNAQAAEDEFGAAQEHTRRGAQNVGGLSRIPTLQVSQNFHVEVEARGTACQVLADKRIGLLDARPSLSIRNQEGSRSAAGWGRLRKDMTWQSGRTLPR